MTLRFLVRAALLLSVTSLLGACRYTFIPLIPPEVNIAAPVRVTDASLTRAGDTLTVRATLDVRTLAPGRAGGYLSVVWAAGDKELARDSVYLDARQPTATFTLDAPGKANYRATLIWEKRILRQLDLRESGDF